MSATHVDPAELDTLSREEAELMAAVVLRAVAKESFRRNRNIVAATQEASQLIHLAGRLETFARAPRSAAEGAQPESSNLVAESAESADVRGGDS